jgi:hypothetical protein
MGPMHSRFKPHWPGESCVSITLDGIETKPCWSVATAMFIWRRRILAQDEEVILRISSSCIQVQVPKIDDASKYTA